jgi:acyl carrier protein
METTDIEHEIRTFLVNNFLFGRPEALVDEESLLGNVIDSSGSLELMMFLQERFAIVMDDDEMANPETFNSVKNVVAYVSRKLGCETQGSLSREGAP